MITELDVQYSTQFLSENGMELIGKSWTANEYILVCKINELISEVNKLKENK